MTQEETQAGSSGPQALSYLEALCPEAELQVLMPLGPPEDI